MTLWDDWKKAQFVLSPAGREFIPNCGCLKATTYGERKKVARQD